MGLVVVLTVVMIILVAAFFKLTLFFGAADETRNATDAGALNVGKHSFDLNVQASLAEEHQFDDVADANKNFNLTNINRVWAKALLANANVAAMAITNQSTTQALLHADQLFRGANSISNKLAEQLKDPNNFYNNFESMTSGNNVRLVSANAQVGALKDSAWQTSYVDRGEDSNIDFEVNQLPLPLPLTSPSRMKSMKIPGYQQIPILDKKFYLVPMRDNDRTHLINPENFNSNTDTAKLFDGWKNPVPNAFSVHGQTNSVNNRAVSWVQVNPQYKFNLGIPHSYIKIKLAGNNAVYTYTQRNLGQENYSYKTGASSPSFTTPEQLKVTFFPVKFGNEYNGASTLYDALFPSSLESQQEHEKVMSTLLQRCREIQKGFSADQLVQVLKTTPLEIAAMQSEYIIFPKKNILIGRSAARAYSEASWINPSTQADGSSKEIAHEDLIGRPNSAWFTVVEPVTNSSIGPLPAATAEHGSFNWAPGSGFDGCLGELSVSRTTTFAAAGVPEPKKDAK